MNNLLNYFIEANLYLICFYLLYQLLLAKDKHFRFNRAFLLGGIFLSITLPFISFSLSPVPESSVSFEGYIMLPAITITSAQTESVSFILKWGQVIGAIYFAGVLFYSFRLVWQMVHIMRHLPLLNSARERKNGYTLVTTNGEIPTCSFFKFLFWDKSVNLDHEEKRQILEHELAHIKQWHSMDVLLIEIIRVIFWFNPVVHFIKSRITEVHEFLADHYATKQIGIENYSKLLTLQIFKSFDFALSNNFHKSQVLKRIRMLKTKKSKSIWLNITLLAPVLALLITVLSCNVAKEILPESSFLSSIKNLPIGWEEISPENAPDKLQSRYNWFKNNAPKYDLHIIKSKSPDFNLEEHLTILRSEDFYGLSVDISYGVRYQLIHHRKLEINNNAPLNTNESEKEIYGLVENQPTPNGGMASFYEYVQSNLKYPVEAKQLGIEGKVYVQFIVDPDGNLTDVKSVKGIGGGCDDEAIRVVKESLPWNPALQDGKKVNVRMILPVTFKLG